MPRRNYDRYYSNFILTINPNVRPVDDDDARQVGELLRQVGARFFTLENILAAMKFRNGGSSDGVSRVEVVSWSVELGTNTRGQRVHIHAYIKVEHTNWMQFDQTTIQHWFMDELASYQRVKNVFVNIRWVPATDELIKAYVEKGILVGGGGQSDQVLLDE